MAASLQPQTATPAQHTQPSRKDIRQWLTPMRHKQLARPLVLILLDSLLWCLFTGIALWAPHPLIQLAAGAFSGLIIGRLFILGHDACHQSLTAHRRLNRWLGRLVFLPSLTPYSLWEVGHNIVHHGYTNLKGFDFVWAPKSRTEYLSLSPGQRWLERLYRSGYAPGLYYLIEIWWQRLFFPRGANRPAQRSVFLLDNLLITAFAMGWCAVVFSVAHATGQHWFWLLFVGFLLPLFVWNSMIGFVVYVHHTHPDVAWYDNKSEWTQSHAFLTSTVHLQFPDHGIGRWMGGFMHHIMEHTAHHVDMSIPLYHLVKAQAAIEQNLPDYVIRQTFSWRWYFDTARRCRLYDFKEKRWLGEFPK